ncbi:MAG TPA: YafY family protein [Candidatus Limnocylindrales bacterium]|nr:YafY family protein [Candidatus Limnocylindrales bacterium]
MRASRLVSLLLLLQSRGGQTAAELARELEVSVRTIHRDVDALSASGVPIYADRGPHGGIRLVDGYRTRLTGMTADEAEALFLSGLPGPAAELGLGTVVAAARLKVLAALPTELRARASRLVERFHLDAAAWYHPDEPVPHLGALSEAVWEAQRVEIGYDRGDKTVDRVLEPLGLVLKAGVWYLVANVDGQPRTYRVSRVSRVRLAGGTFERPAAFDLPSFWAEASAAYERDTPRVTVKLRIAPDRIGRLRDVVGERPFDTLSRLDEPDPDGWERIRITLDWPAEATTQILAVGPGCELLEPADLRQRIRAEARRLAERYAAGELDVSAGGTAMVGPAADAEPATGDAHRETVDTAASRP